MFYSQLADFLQSTTSLRIRCLKIGTMLVDHSLQFGLKLALLPAAVDIPWLLANNRGLPCIFDTVFSAHDVNATHDVGSHLEENRIT